MKLSYSILGNRLAVAFIFLHQRSVKTIFKIWFSQPKSDNNFRMFGSAGLPFNSVLADTKRSLIDRETHRDRSIVERAGREPAPPSSPGSDIETA